MLIYYSRRQTGISNDCNFVIFLVVTVHVSHPYKRVDHTFIIIFLIFMLYVDAVIVIGLYTAETSCDKVDVL